MSEHRKLPKIRGFHNVFKELMHIFKGDLPKSLTWHAKIKLHGTNAAIRFSEDGTITAQKRTDDIFIDNDNMQFAAFVQLNRKLLTEWHETYRQKNTNVKGDIVICGEWAGPGIQKNVAVSGIDDKHFFVFAIMIGEKGKPTEFVYNPLTIRAILTNNTDNMNSWIVSRFRIIPSFSKHTLDPRFRENVLTFIDQLNKIVEVIDQLDPYIFEEFGVKGIGEGLVFYPEGKYGKEISCTKDEFECLAFKVKGEKHAVNKAGKPARLASTTPDSAYEFADMHLTEARLEQGLENIDKIDKSNTGKFLGWVCRDIATESAQEIAESGLDWKTCLSGVIAVRAREWFFKRCDEI